MSMNNELGSIEKDGIRLAIVQDEFADNPRDWEPLGTMVCFHSRYNLGDKHNFENPEAFKEQITEEENYILPLYLYDHSGITISTTPFHCPWDSGQIGWIYVSERKAEEEQIMNPLQALKNEVKEYDDYLTGNVYGFYIETEAEHIDSCYGFCGPIQDSGMRDSIPEEHQHLFDELLDLI